MMKLGHQQKYSYLFEIIIIILGLFFNYFNIGDNKLFGFSSAGNYLIYIGFIALMITTLQAISKKKRKVDERLMAAAMQSTRWTFVLIILAAFVIMVMDGISPISAPYSTFMSYFVCFIIFSNLIIYKLMLKYKY